MLSNEFVLGLLISCLLQESWSRTISITLNLNLDLAKNGRSKLSADMLHNCMKRTEVAMNELTRFRLGPSFNSSPVEPTASEKETMLNTAEDDDGTNKENDVGYNNASPMVIKEKYQEPIRCFAHCIYNQMGLIKNGGFMESEVQRKLYAVLVHEQVQLPECVDLESDNICEAAYKIHLCYSKLKMLESENRVESLYDHMTAIDDTLENVADEMNAADGESNEDVKEN